MISRVYEYVYDRTSFQDLTDIWLQNYCQYQTFIRIYLDNIYNGLLMLTIDVDIHLYRVRPAIKFLAVTGSCTIHLT